MLIAFLLLIVSFVLILAAAEFFTNSIEWFGHRLNLTQGAVGSILAAIGTALPETLVPLLAIFFAKDHAIGHEISTGAILGAPLMLSTIAMGIVGIAIYIFYRQGKRAKPVAEVNNPHMRRDMIFFLIAFALAVGASFLPNMALKWGAAALLITTYVVYVWQVLKHPGEDVEDLSPLYIHKKSEKPHMALIVLQVVGALALMLIGAKLFVNQIEHIAVAFAIPALVLAIVIAPLATELPEKFNSVIWLKAGKDTLALGNISGAMVFQASIIPVIGILMTEWKFGDIEMVAILLTFASAIFIFQLLGRRTQLPYWVFAVGGLIYAVFFGYIIYKSIIS